MELKGPATKPVHVPQLVMKGLHDIALAGMSVPVSAATKVVSLVHAGSQQPGGPVNEPEATVQTFEAVDREVSDASLAESTPASGTPPVSWRQPGVLSAAVGPSWTEQSLEAAAAAAAAEQEAERRHRPSEPQLPPVLEAATEEGPSVSVSTAGPEGTKGSGSLARTEGGGGSGLLAGAAEGEAGSGTLPPSASANRRLLRRMSTSLRGSIVEEVTSSEPGTKLIRIRSGKQRLGGSSEEQQLTPSYRRRHRCARMLAVPAAVLPHSTLCYGSISG